MASMRNLTPHHAAHGGGTLHLHSITSLLPAELKVLTTHRLAPSILTGRIRCYNGLDSAATLCYVYK